jgi:hypothetical protein
MQSEGRESLECHERRMLGDGFVKH